MHARSTTITAATSAIDRGTRYVQDEVLPGLLAMDGCVGVSLLVDRTIGQCIATSAWETEQAMRASEQAVRPLREHFIATFSGTNPIVDEWEVALMHRDHQSRQGACARVSWLQGDPTAAESSIEAFRTVLPMVEELPGFCSASLLINRETGRAVSTVVYDSAAAIAQTRGQASTLRTRAAEQAGAEVLEVAEFELAVAHLRVPELV
jgi:heme-degrading monooxygenase HmoA